MPVFAHDPSRVHPPNGEEPVSELVQQDMAIASMSTEPVVPRTRNQYGNGVVQVAVILGASGVPHRIMYVSVNRGQRGQGWARETVAEVVADFDHDQMESTVIIRNYDPDVDVQRLIAFFQDFGYILESSDPEPFLRRPASPLTP
jgi:hypothetical protein